MIYVELCVVLLGIIFNLCKSWIGLFLVFILLLSSCVIETYISGH